MQSGSRQSICGVFLDAPPPNQPAEFGSGEKCTAKGSGGPSFMPSLTVEFPQTRGGGMLCSASRIWL